MRILEKQPDSLVLEGNAIDETDFGISPYTIAATTIQTSLP